MMPGKQLWPPPVQPSNEARWAPTPEEITEACEMIRAEWSEEMREGRLRPDWRNGSAKVLIAPVPVVS